MSVEIQKDIEVRMWEITIDGGISPEKVMAHANATVEQWKKAT
ncbi:hypothetical protein [Vibrio parahaemolyticus]